MQEQHTPSGHPCAHGPDRTIFINNGVENTPSGNGPPSSCICDAAPDEGLVHEFRPVEKSAGSEPRATAAPSPSARGQAAPSLLDTREEHFKTDLPAWGSAGSSCGGRTIVAWDEDAKVYRVRPALCRQASCFICGPRYRRWLRHCVQGSVDLMGLDRLLTLTLRAGGMSPGESRAKLMRCWNRLREWITRTLGALDYLWVVEVTARGTFHLHVLVDRYLPRSQVKRAWEHITGDSWGVDVRALRGNRAARYISKYVTKLAGMRRDPAWSFLKGKRLFSKSRSLRFVPFMRPTESSGGWLVVPDSYWAFLARKRRSDAVVEATADGIPSFAYKPASGLPGVAAATALDRWRALQAEGEAFARFALDYLGASVPPRPPAVERARSPAPRYEPGRWWCGDRVQGPWGGEAP